MNLHFLAPCSSDMIAYIWLGEYVCTSAIVEHLHRRASPPPRQTHGTTSPYFFVHLPLSLLHLCNIIFSLH